MAEKKVFGNDGPSKDPDVPQATFDKSFTNNLTMRIGRCYPVFVDMVPPNSTAHVTPHVALDMMPTVSPIQANIHSHLSFYKLPLRILWKNYADFFSRVGNHTVPYINRGDLWCENGSLADYMGLPTMNFKNIDTTKTFKLIHPGFISYSSLYLNSSEARFSSFFHKNRILSFPNSGPDSIQPYDLNAAVVPIQDLLKDGLFTGFLLKTDAFPTRESSQMFIYVKAYRLRKSSRFRDVVVSNHSYLSDLESHDTSDLVCIDDSGNPERLTYKQVSTLDYPFTQVEPNFIELGPQSTTTYLSYTLFRKRFVIRLSDSLLSYINDSYHESSSDLVVLVISWADNSNNDRIFGDSTQLDGVTAVTSLQRSDFTLSAPIVTQSTEEGKVNESTLVQTSSFFPPYRGFQRSIEANVTTVVNHSSDRNPFVSYNGEPPQIPINAFTFRAYEFLHNYVFRNPRVDPFILDGQPSYNKFITNDGDGADSTTPVDFFQVPYEFDLFTTSQKSPQMGDAPLVGITTNSDETSATMLMRGKRVLPDGTTEDFDYSIPLSLGPNGQITTITNYDEIANLPSVARLNEAIKYGISINDFRNVNSYQIMKERFLKCGYLYPDLVQEFFGVRPPVGENYPEYLGGVTRPITIKKVENVALSETAQLGEFAGSGQLEAHGQQIDCFCSEWSIIMGVMWLSVTPIYSQKLDKHFTYHHFLDFYNPQLASIGPQPVYKYQLAPLQLPRLSDGSLDPAHINDVFGYARSWSDLVSRQDEAHGEFRTSMYTFLMQRLFAETPDLGHNFLTIDSSDLTDVFSYTYDTDKFFGAVLFEYICRLPLPKVSIPRIV